ncbi:MAG: hypothetical protein R3324_16490, partial [Halobacteriales archaeon]|nr:hypothetical protein [Halobacteriales archaeon]
FLFNVYDSSQNLVEQDVAITFTAGETSDSATVTDLAPGSYTVQEEPHESGDWKAQGNETAEIVLPDCSGSVTFTNDHGPATARVAKVTVPDTWSNDWEFTLTGPGITGGETKTATANGGYVTFDTELQEGEYTVTETKQDGWDLTGVTLNDQAQSGEVCSFTVDYPADANESFPCEFTNRQHGSITIEKETDPDGSTQSFDFDASSNLGDDFALQDGESELFGGLAPGTYSVSELVPEGWQLTSIECRDASTSSITDGVSITLEAGEDVTCTFNNREDSSITVVKKTVPAGSSEVFTFDPGDLGDDFGLSDGESKTFDTLAPGTYGVDEDVPAGWDLIDITCDDDDATTDSTGFSIALEAGEDVECTFTNREHSSITVIKQTVPDGSEQVFTFDPSDSLS